MLTIGRRSLLAGGIAALATPAFGTPAHSAPTREMMVPVEGGRIYARVNGDVAGPRAPVVFVHGGPGGTHAHFLEMLSLAPERAVILYDQLDSGRSDRPDDPRNWRVGRFVDELDAIRRALRIARWHVVGHSWGGTLALEYAARRPAALGGACLAGPLVSTRRWLADAALLIDRLPATTAADVRRCIPLPAPQPDACTRATATFYAAFNRRERESAAVAAYRAGPGRGSNPRLYRTMWGDSEFVSTGTLRDYDGEPLLARLDGSRTLFLGGQYDEARPATLLDYADRVPGAEVALVPGAAHGMFTDRPAETRAILAAWLARQDARP